jgi:hypothetical protein
MMIVAHPGLDFVDLCQDSVLLSLRDFTF